MEKPPISRPPSRAERQAAALRANLKRRKAGAAPKLPAATGSPGQDAPPPAPDSKT